MTYEMPSHASMNGRRISSVALSGTDHGLRTPLEAPPSIAAPQVGAATAKMGAGPPRTLAISGMHQFHKADVDDDDIWINGDDQQANDDMEANEHTADQERVTTGPPKSEQDYFHAISLINSVAGNEPWTGACDGGLDAAALEVVFPSPAGMAQGAQGALGHPQAKEETTTPTSDPGFLGPTPTLRAGAARGRPQPRGWGPSQQASPKEVRGSAWSRGKGGHRRPSPGLHQHAAAPYHLGTRAAARTGAATESERSSKTQASHAGGSEPPGASRGSRSPS